MTLQDALAALAAWLQAQSAVIGLGFAALPVLGTVAARIGKGGRTDADGRLIASLVIGLAVLLVFLELGGLWLASKVLRKDMLTVALRGDAILLLGPPASLVASVLGLRLVFPLSELATVRTLRDVALLLAMGYGAVWLMGKFTWGIYFIGSVVEFVVLAGIAVGVAIMLYRRSFR